MLLGDARRLELFPCNTESHCIAMPGNGGSFASLDAVPYGAQDAADKASLSRGESAG